MEERSRAVSFVFGGLSVGSVTGYVLSGMYYDGLVLTCTGPE